MQRTKHVIAVMVVATALCADRDLSAAQVHKPISATNRSFVSRLTSNLRQSVAPVRMLAVRTDERAIARPTLIREAASGVRGEFSPFQFRLPPPAR